MASEASMPITILDLLADAVGLSRGQVDLVQDRDNIVIRIDGLVDIGQRLGLDALGGVHHQQAALNRAHASADLIGEIDVAGGVDEVEDVGFAVLCGHIRYAPSWP